MERCATCGQHVSWTGPLCIEPLPWDPTRTYARCKKCIVAMEAFRAEASVIQEDMADLWEHRQDCRFCRSWRGVIPSLALSKMCSEKTKAAEARRVA